MLRVSTVLVSCAVVLTSSANADQTCEPTWIPTFGGSAGLGGATARAMAVFDDGAGPALYVGGSFGTAGGIPASFIAKWQQTSTGGQWSALAGGMNGEVLALATFDDGHGAGPAL